MKNILFHHEFLLYDFNLGIGDSVILPITLCDTTYTSTVYVTSVDSVLLEDMNYRRRINLMFYYPFSWIEGIGSDDGLLYPKFIGTACVCDTELICFRQNDSFLYYNETNMPCFDFIVSNKEDVYIYNNFQLYPNPTKNEITISGFKGQRNTEVNIYTQTGQKAFTIISPNKTIDISYLKPGLYFAEIKTSEGDVMRKIVVQ